MITRSPLAKAMTTDLAILQRDRRELVKLLTFFVQDAQACEDGSVYLRTTPERLAMAWEIIEAARKDAQ